MDQLLDLEIVDSIREVGGARPDDSFARELFELFSEQSEMATRELRVALARGDMQQVRYFAHRLKGSAANIGASQLSGCAERLERAAQSGGTDTDTLATAAAELTGLRTRSLSALATVFGCALGTNSGPSV